MFSSFISFFSSFLALQFRINEGLLSDDIRKAYRDELVRRKAEGGHEDESEMRMIHGLETYKMEANPKYTKLFAEDAVYVTNMRKSRGNLADLRDKSVHHFCCGKKKDDEDGDSSAKYKSVPPKSVEMTGTVTTEDV